MQGVLTFCLFFTFIQVHKSVRSSYILYKNLQKSSSTLQRRNIFYLMDIFLICGASRHKITINANDPVSDLMCVVETLTKIKQDEQTLIYKGLKISKDPSQSLNQFNIKGGAKIMVIGRRYDAEEKKLLKQLENIHTEADSSLKIFEELQREADSLLKGFIPDDSKIKALEAIRKKTCACSEKLMKHLETMDGMVLSCTFEDAKLQRKTIVNQVQKCLDKCEQLVENLEHEISKT